jgi:hypothetical protein
MPFSYVMQTQCLKDGPLSARMQTNADIFSSLPILGDALHPDAYGYITPP